MGTVFCADDDRGQRAAARIQAAYKLGDEAPAELPALIKEVIDE